MSYLGDFLFAPQRVDSPVKMLSGGERNRLLLARLFARPANVLVLDEPTNDLDIDSLELLESTLQEYGGTVLLVSHDRAFLDNVVTQTLAAEGDGTWREYVGGYRDWLEQRPAARTVDAAAGDGTRAPRVDKASRVATSGSADPASRARAAKLSYKETRELEQLPAQIEALEAEQRELTARMSSGDYHRQGAAQIKAGPPACARRSIDCSRRPTNAGRSSTRSPARRAETGEKMRPRLTAGAMRHSRRQGVNQSWQRLRPAISRVLRPTQRGPVDLAGEVAVGATVVLAVTPLPWARPRDRP